MQSHYLNQCWNIVNWTLRNKLKWDFNWNSNISFMQMHLKVLSGKWQPFCLGINVLMTNSYHSSLVQIHTVVTYVWIICSHDYLPLWKSFIYVCVIYMCYTSIPPPASVKQNHVCIQFIHSYHLLVHNSNHMLILLPFAIFCYITVNHMYKSFTNITTSNC